MTADDFDCQPDLRGSSLRLKPLADSDLEGMFKAAADPHIWAGHPARDRYKRDVFEAYFASLLATKKALAVVDIACGDIVGTSSYYTPPDLPNSIAIGFTFSWTCQSGGYGNSERENSFAQVVSDKLDEFVKSQGYEDRYVEGLDACDAFIRQLMHDVPVAQEYFF